MEGSRGDSRDLSDWVPAVLPLSLAYTTSNPLAIASFHH